MITYYAITTAVLQEHHANTIQTMPEDLHDSAVVKQDSRHNKYCEYKTLQQQQKRFTAQLHERKKKKKESQLQQTNVN